MYAVLISLPYGIKGYLRYRSQRSLELSKEPFPCETLPSGNIFSPGPLLHFTRELSHPLLLNTLSCLLLCHVFTRSPCSPSGWLSFTCTSGLIIPHPLPLWHPVCRLHFLVGSTHNFLQNLISLLVCKWIPMKNVDTIANKNTNMYKLTNSQPIFYVNDKWSNI